MIIAWIAWSVPDALHGSNATAILVYIASHGFNPRGIIVALFAIYPAVVGVGLWLLQPWARNILIITSLWTIGGWGRFLLFNQFLSGTTLYTHILDKDYQRQAVCALLLVDVLTAFYLWLGNGVRTAFGVKD